jgi:hypothetical protein
VPAVGRADAGDEIGREVDAATGPVPVARAKPILNPIPGRPDQWCQLGPAGDGFGHGPQDARQGHRIQVASGRHRCRECSRVRRASASEEPDPFVEDVRAFFDRTRR